MVMAVSRANMKKQIEKGSKTTPSKKSKGKKPAGKGFVPFKKK
jgi:hypothetical protein